MQPEPIQQTALRRPTASVAPTAAPVGTASPAPDMPEPTGATLLALAVAPPALAGGLVHVLAARADGLGAALPPWTIVDSAYARAERLTGAAIGRLSLYF
jgi:hypothetical protein